jgi:uncharacterized DUF497 family protein
MFAALGTKPLVVWYKYGILIIPLGARKVRFDWDDTKSEKLKRERGLSFNEASAVFSDAAYVSVPKNDDPEQFAAIGFAQDNLITLVYEYREDALGELIWLITYWPSTKREVSFYEKFKKR